MKSKISLIAFILTLFLFNCKNEAGSKKGLNNDESLKNKYELETETKIVEQIFSEVIDSLIVDTLTIDGKHNVDLYHKSDTIYYEKNFYEPIFDYGIFVRISQSFKFTVDSLDFKPKSGLYHLNITHVKGKVLKGFSGYEEFKSLISKSYARFVNFNFSDIVFSDDLTYGVLSIHVGYAYGRGSRYCAIIKKQDGFWRVFRLIDYQSVLFL